MDAIGKADRNASRSARLFVNLQIRKLKLQPDSKKYAAFPARRKRRSFSGISAPSGRFDQYLWVELGDRDLNPDYLIQSQAFCRLNYPPSNEFIPRILTCWKVTNQIQDSSETSTIGKSAASRICVGPEIPKAVTLLPPPCALPRT